ncbi:MGDG synthase family glycosyltransferase [Clostridium vincentii]|uniref:Processive diacylglycerol beta-glucosyltransferase n=1 Tax=Clostridium vincentii TaxID=52704 RepID=A0A2T0BGZ6_9CLOT|nr:glycosyltransferase [Clostridium vincentii]PRR83166.1 Processive diacylglycerol beta-glucosyltransferase [Clostridium vincentii]
MKKVLILTTSTGQGHNQAANSLVEVFTEYGFNCIKHDFLANNNKVLNDLVVWGYEISASRFPSIYGWFYEFTDSAYINKLNSLLFANATRKLSKLIKKEKPELIIGTHPFIVNIISNLKKRGLKTPFISVTTDFKAHYTYVNPLVDAYITGSLYTKNSLIDRGIKEDLIYPIGIPIRASFFCKNIIIPELKYKDKDYFNLLLMSGSMGLKNISYVLDELLTNTHKLRITVVCGSNEQLLKSLQKKAEQTYRDKKLHIVGFSNDIASFMEYSDILISKPGGLTVTEAIVKDLPLIIPFVIPGQEMDNTDFLTSNGYAYYVKDFKSINSVVDKLIDNPKYLIEMKDKLHILASSYSLKSVIDIANNLIKNS